MNDKLLNGLLLVLLVSTLPYILMLIYAYTYAGLVWFGKYIKSNLPTSEPVPELDTNTSIWQQLKQPQYTNEVRQVYVRKAITEYDEKQKAETIKPIVKASDSLSNTSYNRLYPRVMNRIANDRNYHDSMIVFAKATKYTCSKCNNAFNTQKALNGHQKMHRVSK